VSVEAISAVLNHSHPSITNVDLGILIALANEADSDGVAWPGIPRIARIARVSERTVQRTISKASAVGDLLVERQGGTFTKDSQGKTVPLPADRHTNWYRLTPGGEHVRLHRGDRESPRKSPLSPDSLSSPSSAADLTALSGDSGASGVTETTFPRPPTQPTWTEPPEDPLERPLSEIFAEAGVGRHRRRGPEE
jgi:hypothetical protein